MQLVKSGVTAIQPAEKSYCRRDEVMFVSLPQAAGGAFLATLQYVPPDESIGSSLPGGAAADTEVRVAERQ